MKKLLLLTLFWLFAPVAVLATTYQVQPGDTLTRIAQRFDTTVSQLVFDNHIADKNVIKVNQTLVVGSESPVLGATAGSDDGGYTPVTGYQSNTTAYITSVATTIPVVSTKDKALHQIILGNISPAAVVKVYMNIEPGTSKEEPVVCTGITATSWTNCTRGLPFQSGSESTSSTAQAHNAGAAVVITNISQFYNQYVSIDGNQTVNFVKTFTQLPLGPTSTPTNTQQFITLYQLQQATSTGGINGSETVKGVWQGASRSEMAAGTAVGSTGANLVLQSQYASSAPSATTTIPITNTAGKLSSSFGGSASTLATLNADSLVVQNPVNASTSAGVGLIPIASSTGGLDGATWVTGSLTNGNATSLHYHDTVIYYTASASAVSDPTVTTTLYQFTIPANTIVTSTVVSFQMPYSVTASGIDNLLLQVLANSSTIMASTTILSGANFDSSNGVALGQIISSGRQREKTFLNFNFNTSTKYYAAFDYRSSTIDFTTSTQIDITARANSGGAGLVFNTAGLSVIFNRR